MPSLACGGCSSVGRAPGCGPGGRGFKSHHSPHSVPFQALHRRAFFRVSVQPRTRGGAVAPLHTRCRCRPFSRMSHLSHRACGEASCGSLSSHRCRTTGMPSARQGNLHCTARGIGYDRPAATRARAASALSHDRADTLLQTVAEGAVPSRRGGTGVVSRCSLAAPCGQGAGWEQGALRGHGVLVGRASVWCGRCMGSPPPRRKIP